MEKKGGVVRKRRPKRAENWGAVDHFLPRGKTTNDQGKGRRERDPPLRKTVGVGSNDSEGSNA